MGIEAIQKMAASFANIDVNNASDARHFICPTSVPTEAFHDALSAAADCNRLLLLNRQWRFMFFVISALRAGWAVLRKAPSLDTFPESAVADLK